jgi:ubiquinone/menaquinone biosynthesis C-methylase UbiE
MGETDVPRDITAEIAERQMSALKTYTESNRRAWNEVMPLHQKAAKAKWDSAFMQPGYSRLSELQTGILNQIGVGGKNVVHLCCNNGVELMSVKNIGAASCVGFDISDAAIAEAEERAQICGIDCRFVRCDVYEIRPEYDAQFDIAVTTVGCLGWLPDLARFFARSAALLRPGGYLFTHEIHPFFEMLPCEGDTPDALLRIVEPYFRQAPFVDYGGLDYLGNTQYESTEAQYWFVHTLSSVLTALIGNGLTIEQFHEYDTAISPHQRPVENLKAGVPLSYTLVARKLPV